jgi:hypothetical protein
MVTPRLGSHLIEGTGGTSFATPYLAPRMGNPSLSIREPDGGVKPADLRSDALGFYQEQSLWVVNLVVRVSEQCAVNPGAAG